MRFIRVCLLFTLFVHPVFGAKFVHQSSRQIPVVRKVDLIVIGGTLGAVAAATEAAEEGVNVLLVGSRPYIGEDICATMHLWLNEGETLHGKLTKQIFSDKHITTPINVKKTLEAALLDAGVGFLLCCYPTDILVEDDGHLAGVVIANRAGRQAVLGKVIIDATDRAIVAKLADVKRRPWLSGNKRCTRVVLGGKTARRLLPTREIPAGIRAEGRNLFYYEYILVFCLYSIDG